MSVFWIENYLTSFVLSLGKVFELSLHLRMVGRVHLCGAINQIRTGDLFLTKEVLYLLSYNSIWYRQRLPYCVVWRALRLKPPLTKISFLHGYVRSHFDGGYQPLAKSYQVQNTLGYRDGRTLVYSSLTNWHYTTNVGNDPTFCGAGGRTWTPNLLITGQLLYHLSYTSILKLRLDVVPQSLFLTQSTKKYIACNQYIYLLNSTVHHILSNFLCKILGAPRVDSLFKENTQKILLYMTA